MSRPKTHPDARDEPRGRGKAATGMRPMAIDLAGLDAIKGDDLALFCWSDVRPLVGVAGLVDWRLCGALSQGLQRKQFQGVEGEVMLFPVSGRFGPRRLFVFGLGPVLQWEGVALRDGCRLAVEVMRKAGAGSVLMAAPASRDHAGVEAAFVKAADDEMAGQIVQVLTEKV